MFIYNNIINYNSEQYLIHMKDICRLCIVFYKKTNIFIYKGNESGQNNGVFFVQIVTRLSSLGCEV